MTNSKLNYFFKSLIARDDGLHLHSFEDYHLFQLSQKTVQRPFQDHMKGLIIALCSSRRVIGFVCMYDHTLPCEQYLN